MIVPFPIPRVAGRPLVLGHRGASRDAPENTLAAFRLALAQGADGVELDVRRCRTGEVVVFHDLDAKRLTASSLRIGQSSLVELRQLDLGRGERIPLLREVLQALPDAVLNVELKSDRVGDPILAREVGRLLREYRAEQRAIVSSFDHLLLCAFRLLEPQIPIGLLFGKRMAWKLRLAASRRVLPSAALHPGLPLATDEHLRDWLRQRRAVLVWTVDDPAEVARLCQLQVAGVITNTPGPTRELVRRTSGR